MEFTNHNPQERMRVIELGAGHGRVANVILHAVANVQVVIVDIPPALYVSQWYLSNLFQSIEYSNSGIFLIIAKSSMNLKNHL